MNLCWHMHICEDIVDVFCQWKWINWNEENINMFLDTFHTSNLKSFATGKNAMKIHWIQRPVPLFRQFFLKGTSVLIWNYHGNLAFNKFVGNGYCNHIQHFNFVLISEWKLITKWTICMLVMQRNVSINPSNVNAVDCDRNFEWVVISIKRMRLANFVIIISFLINLLVRLINRDLIIIRHLCVVFKRFLIHWNLSGQETTNRI